MHTEEIIEAVGGMSRFQILLMFVLLPPKIVSAMSMLMMSFASVTPEEWWCVDENAEEFSNATLKYCPPSTNGSTCTFVYSEDKYTIVNEWDLVCDLSSMKKLPTSVQMGGVMVGAFLGGQSADVIGRKKTFFVALLLEGGFNLVAAFSVSWQMFTVLRFFIGLAIGLLFAVFNPFYMEFVPVKYRPVSAIAPFWQGGTALLALSCWLRPNWYHQHLITAALHIPFLLGWFFAPESLRWLAVHGHVEEAEAVVDKIARLNRKEKPTNTTAILKHLAEAERKSRDSTHKYTYLDIYRHWSVRWKSISLQFAWMCMSFVFYGISFGVGHLTGNLYVNMFLVGFISVPSNVILFFLANRIGRRKSGFLFCLVATLGAFGVAVASRVGSGNGTLITALAILCRLGVATGWGLYHIWTSEMYPTVIRNLGYGASNSAARIGGIISPYIFGFQNGGDLLIPFIIVGSILTYCTLLTLVLPETMGKPLEDVTATVPEASPVAEEVKTEKSQTKISA